MLDIRSKLPHVGTTIFTVISQRAKELGAINLAQGFPDYDPPTRLKALIAHHLDIGHNQYAPMAGVETLREQIAIECARRYGREIDPVSQITVTLGATEALFSGILALAHPGDEVLLFDPSYDAYGPAVELAGARPVRLALSAPDFHIDWQRVRDALNDRTRLLVINTPHNPTGAVLKREDLETLAELLRHSPALVVADEVYDHMVFDGRNHCSFQAQEELAERSLSVYSFGKNVHATGYRVGYAVAPAGITQELRRVHQFNTFSITTPLQYALADFMRESPEHFAGLGAFYESKRNRFLNALRDSDWKLTPTPGTYFQLLDYSRLSQAADTEFADRLLREIGVASIPLSPFYEQPPHQTYLRFCFAKTEATLDEAAERLRRFAA
jgi:methionine transaminase